ncbi:MAG: hypothetical protein AAFX81_07545 [Pseudomonadota bacterium]
MAAAQGTVTFVGTGKDKAWSVFDRNRVPERAVSVVASALARTEWPPTRS